MRTTTTKIQISNSRGRETDDDLLPYCPPQVYEELSKDFNLNALMTHNSGNNNDEHIGYIRGVMDVLQRVKVYCKLNNEESDV